MRLRSFSGRSGEAANSQLGIHQQHHGAGGPEDVLQIVAGDVELGHAVLELLVERDQLLVGRLQLLLRGLELLVGALELLVGALELLVGALELLGRCLGVLRGGLEVFLGAGQLALELLDAASIGAASVVAALAAGSRPPCSLNRTRKVFPTAPGSGRGVTSRVTATRSSSRQARTGLEMTRTLSTRALLSEALSSGRSSGRASLRRLTVARPGLGSKKRPVLPRYWRMSKTSLTTTPGRAVLLESPCGRRAGGR
jgi:hypothetical protein